MGNAVWLLSALSSQILVPDLSQHLEPLPVLAGELCTPGLGSGVDGCSHVSRWVILLVQISIH